MATKEKKGKGKDDKKSKNKNEDTPIPQEDNKLEDSTPTESEVPVEEPPTDEPAPKEPTPEPVYDEPTLTELIVESYEGEKERGLYEGEGCATFLGEHVYQGNFHQGMMHGHGKYSWTDGVIYEGEFTHNKITGKGMYTWPDGSTYEGEVLDGFRHGHGVYKSKDNKLSYVGDWCYGKRHGKGRINYDSEGKSYYEGDLVNNIRHGWGVRHYPSGNNYDGMWFNNLRHGDGTMKWIDRNQMYVGQWEDGIQHGMGQHIWFLRRVGGSQYPLRNMYDGEFVYGLRHGYGSFYYANGASYQGVWSNNYKHGKGKFTFKNGRIYEGMFEKDHIIEFPNFSIDGTTTPDMTQIRTRTPLPQENMSVHSNMSANTFSPSFQLEIDNLLNEFTEIDREEEANQVMCVILRHMTDLKRVYNYYSGLGFEESPDNTFIMNRMQLWRFMKDCRFHHMETTLSQMDRELAVDKKETNVHNPYDRVLLREFLNHIVTLAYHIYHEEHEGTGPLLSWCLSKLISDNILRFSCKVKGTFYREARRAVNALVHMDHAYNVYTDLCKPRKYSPYEPVLKMRDFLHLMKTYNLINNDLTPKAVIEVLAQDDPAVSDDEGACNLELEMTFLEFFEALVGCAERYVTEAVVKDPNTPRPSTVLTHEGRENSTMSSPMTQSRGISQLADHDDVIDQNSPTHGTGSDACTPIGQRVASSADMTHRTHKTETTIGHQEAQPSNASHVSVLEQETEDRGDSAKFIQSETMPENTKKSASFVSSHSGDVADESNILMQSIISMGGHTDMDPTEAEEIEEYVEELDEGTRNFNFWTHQVHIFFVKKFFPAAEKMALLNARIRVQEQRNKRT